jgi:hypothetical protein
MIKARINKDGSSILRVFIDRIDEPIENGVIELYLVDPKKEKTLIAKQPYEKLTLVYDFDMADNSPYNIGDYNYSVIIKDETSVSESKPMKLFGGAPMHIRGAIKKIRYDFQIVAKQYNGSKAYLFKRIPGQEKCPACWDEDLQSSSNSNCLVCGGTGFISYYSKPYKTYAGPLHFANEAFSTEDAGKVLQSPLIRISMLADFILMENDIIFYEKTRDWLRVKDRTISELQTYPVLQSFTAAVMPSGSPEIEVAKKQLERM